MGLLALPDLAERARRGIEVAALGANQTMKFFLDKVTKEGPHIEGELLCFSLE